jgi:CcmD family protein
MKKIFLVLYLLVAVSGANVLIFAQPGQTEFVPVTELPASEQLPAARLLIVAYAFVWVAILAYLWMMWRRLDKVEREISTLSAQLIKKRP